jgi:Cu+-exporting ATPase
MVKDLVCGMDVDPKGPGVFSVEHEGKTYYFCADHCKRSFLEAPRKYLSQARGAK